VPKVSVILPNYKHAKFLQQRIDSILQQSFADFELIILDDKSPDNSIEIIEKYRGNKHISHIVYNEVNSGRTFAQWSKGVALSSGEYIWMAESDDAAHPDFLATMVKILDENRQVSAAYCQSYAIDEAGTVSGTWLRLSDKLDEKKWRSDFISRGTEYIKNYMIYVNVIPNASAVLFRKSAREQWGITDQTFRLNGDWKFWISLLIHSDVAYVAECLNYFRTHVTTNRSTTMMAGLNFLEYTRIISFVFSNIAFTKEEKRKVIIYFDRQLSYNAPITFANLIKSYFNLARFDLFALRLLRVQIQTRYF
jgi:glycosyltransferase involved in cell wall biosynthesis